MPKIEVNLSEAAAKTFETIFNTDDPKVLAQSVDFDVNDFKNFLQEENIEIDKDLNEFIKALQQKAQPQAAGRMTLTAIVNQLANTTGISQNGVKEVFDNLAQLAAKEIRENGEFIIPQFGKLIKASYKAREGRNPATGNPIKIPAKTTAKFRLGKAMKDAVK